MEIATKQQAALTPLDVLAQETRFYSESFVTNTLNLGRVLTEAKKQVKHGEWGEWVRENTGGMSVRAAQQFMAAWSRFGGKEAFAGIERSKMYKMLALPEGTEEDFLASHDVAAMSSREVEEAVRKVRAELNAQIAQEKKARKEAEERAEALEMEKDKVPDHIMDSLIQKENIIDKMRSASSLAEHEKRLLEKEIASLQREAMKLRRDIEDRDAMIEEAQQEHERVCADLLNMQSAAAKGDAERGVADEFTVDVFAGAVRQFIGICARLPHMRGTFATMLLSEKNAYDELLKTIESWARDARAALDTVDCGEVHIHD